MGGNPFAVTIRHIIQGEVRVSAGYMSLKSRERSKLEKQIYSSIHVWYLKLGMRSPRKSWYPGKRKGPKTKIRGTPDCRC